MDRFNGRLPHLFSAWMKAMLDDYPYSELEVFVAGYERGRRFARSAPAARPQVVWLAEELATRRLTMYDLSSEGLTMLGMRADFIPREIFEAGVLRALADATWSASRSV